MTAVQASVVLGCLLTGVVLVVLLLVRSGSVVASGPVLITVVAGISGALSGAEVLRRSGQGVDRDVFRRWMGLTLLAWSLGQLVQAVLIADGG
jgi:hypothetical protein